MSQATVALSHPILFVMDFGNDDMIVPTYDEESLTANNDSCVSVRTIADVDGDVTVRLNRVAGNSTASTGIQVFQGDVATPTGRIAVVTSLNEKILEMDVASATTRVVITVDDLRHPAQVNVDVYGAGSDRLN